MPRSTRQSTPSAKQTWPRTEESLDSKASQKREGEQRLLPQSFCLCRGGRLVRPASEASVPTCPIFISCFCRKGWDFNFANVFQQSRVDPGISPARRSGWKFFEFSSPSETGNALCAPLPRLPPLSRTPSPHATNSPPCGKSIATSSSIATPAPEFAPAPRVQSPSLR